MANANFMFSEFHVEEARPLKLVAQFNFPLNVWQVDKKQLSSSELDVLNTFLASQEAAKEINVHGYASPEGSLKRNQELAKQRAQIVRDYLAQELRNAKYSEESIKRIFTLGSTPEDWEGFKTLVAKSNLPQDQKDRLVAIAGSSVDAVEKEKQVMEIVGGKGKIEHLLAPLRRTQVTIQGKERGLTFEKIDSISVLYTQGKIDRKILNEIFNQEEWLGAIERFNDPEGKKTMWIAYYDKFPTDYRAYNDLGLL